MRTDKVVTDSVGSVESLIKDVFRRQTETVTLTETVTKTVDKILTETITLQETLTPQVNPQVATGPPVGSLCMMGCGR